MSCRPSGIATRGTPSARLARARARAPGAPTPLPSFAPSPLLPIPFPCSISSLVLANLMRTTVLVAVLLDDPTRMPTFFSSYPFIHPSIHRTSTVIVALVLVALPGVVLVYLMRLTVLDTSSLVQGAWACRLRHCRVSSTRRCFHSLASFAMSSWAWSFRFPFRFAFPFVIHLRWVFS